MGTISSYEDAAWHRRGGLAHRADIQGLRAIAILLVVLAHARFPLFGGGFVGVDVFFVISGYLITGVLVRGYLNRNGLLEFHARRLRRLLPALSFMLAVVMLVSPLLLTPREVSEQTTSLAYAATWLSNFFFAYSAIDYFAELRGKDLFLHTWSLGLEEQFNLAWPVLLSLAYACGLRARWAERRALGLMVLALLLASLVLSVLLSSGEHAPAAYYLLHTRLWEFLLGAAVYVFHMDRAGVNGLRQGARNFWGWSQVLGLLLILGAAVGFHDHMSYPGALALIPSLGAGLVLVSGPWAEGGLAARLLGSRWMTWMGDRSYSWYLWHWPVLMIGQARGMGGDTAGSVALVLVSLAIACASYQLIELPFWKGRFSGMARKRVFLLSCLAMGMPIAIANFPLAGMETDGPAVAPVVSAAQAARNDLPWIYAQSCDWSFKNADLTPCVRGNKDARKVVVLAGDSIGAQWASALSHLFDEAQWKIVVVTKSSCPMVDQDVYLRDHKIFQKCREWREKVLNYLPTLQPDIVFLGSASSYGFTARQWAEGSASVLARIAPSAGRVIVIAGTPRLSFDGPACLERAEAMGEGSAEVGQCTEKVSMAPWDDVTAHLRESLSRYPSARLLNLNDLVCPEGVCRARMEGGVAVFRDTQHLTDTFVRTHAAEISRRLQAMGVLSSPAGRE